jgi:hypothetical protein
MPENSQARHTFFGHDMYADFTERQKPPSSFTPKKDEPTESDPKWPDTFALHH